MDSFLVVENCSQLVTLAGPKRPRVREEMTDLAIVEDGAMVVRAGRIEWVGPRGELPASRGAERIDAGGRVVMPGFVDAHAHPVFGGNRVDEFEMRSGGATYQQIAAAGGGIRSTVRKTREATEDDLFEAGKRHIGWFLKGGTTTLEAKSGYGLSLEAEVKILRTVRRLGQETPMRLVPTFLGAHSFPDEFRDRKDDYVRLVIDEMLPLIADEKLANYCDIFCEANYFDPASTRLILEAAKLHGFGLRMHADQLTLCGGAELAASLKAKTADHLEQTDTAGIQALKAAGVQPVLLPGSVYALGLAKYPAAREMIEAGLGLVLATDFNPGSSPTTSMPMILSLACTHMGMLPSEAICAATINPAYSLDLGDQVGSLEVGKEADFAIFDVADYREIPYFFGSNHVERVFISGTQVV